MAEYPRRVPRRAAPACSRSATRWNPDRMIVLTSSTDTIEKHIRLRNRPHEAAENMVRRFRLIDAEFRRLAPLIPNTVVIDRDGIEFHERQGLDTVIRAAVAPALPESPHLPAVTWVDMSRPVRASATPRRLQAARCAPEPGGDA